MAQQVSRLTWIESLSTLVQAGGPLFAKGIILRRPMIVRWLQATGLERRGIAAIQRLRGRHGEGPAVLKLGVRKEMLLLAPTDVQRLLDDTPIPFSPDSREKHATLAHFEPAGSLISRGPAREVRRSLNDHALESGCPRHSLASRFESIVADEMTPLVGQATLSFETFRAAWFRMARRCLFGDDARDDVALTRMLFRLRGDANWAFLKPKRKHLRARFLSHVARYLHRPAPNSLAERLASAASPGSRPEDQVGQWLFAFDAASIATFRTLMVLAADPAALGRSREDRDSARPFLRACVLEAVRLWPTTPLVLRQSDRPTLWHGQTIPAATGFAVHLPFLHRDTERLPHADRFSPAIWLDGTAERDGFVPFSAGPAECPAKNLVLMLASATLRTLIRLHQPVLPEESALDPHHLPATLDPFTWVLRLQPHPRDSPCAAPT